MSLLQLPPELLQLIIEQTFSKDFESFALSCKDVFNLSKKHMVKHKQLKKYKHCVLDPNTETGRERLNGTYSVPTTLHLLELIAKEPVIAEYIEFADLKEGLVYDDNYRVDWEEDFLVKVRADGHIERLVEKSCHLQEANQDLDYWLNHVICFGDQHHFADLFLMTLLSNVTYLTLPADDWNGFPAPPRNCKDRHGLSMDSATSSKLWNVLDVLQRRANDKSLSNAGLSRLTTIKPSTGTGYSNHFALQTYAPFLAINTVKAFFAGSCYAEGGMEDENDSWATLFKTRYPQFGANLELVEMSGACLRATHITEFLSPMPRIKSLKLSYEHKKGGFGVDWDAGAFIAAIVSTTKDSLEDLSLSIMTTTCFAYTGIGTVTMKGFQKLRTLELDTLLLHRPAWSGRDWQHPLLDECGPEGIPRLVEILPTSLVGLTLLKYDSVRFPRLTKGLFSGFAEDLRVQLPLLSSITIESTISENQSQVAVSHPILGTDDALTWLYVDRKLQPDPGLYSPRRADPSEASFQRTFNERFAVENPMW